MRRCRWAISRRRRCRGSALSVAIDNGGGQYGLRESSGRSSATGGRRRAAQRPPAGDHGETAATVTTIRAGRRARHCKTAQNRGLHDRGQTGTAPAGHAIIRSPEYNASFVGRAVAQTALSIIVVIARRTATGTTAHRRGRSLQAHRGVGADVSGRTEPNAPPPSRRAARHSGSSEGSAQPGARQRACRRRWSPPASCDGTARLGAREPPPHLAHRNVNATMRGDGFVLERSPVPGSAWCRRQLRVKLARRAPPPPEAPRPVGGELVAHATDSEAETRANRPTRAD